jgi:opacity protein-like surface antigen
MTPTRRTAIVLSLAACVVASAAPPVHGQQRSGGVIASASVSADPDTRWSLAGSVGYRFNKILAMGTELTWSSLKYSLPDIVDPYETVTFSRPRRDLVSFTSNVRAELPNCRRILPYVVVGGGVASDSIAYTTTITSPATRETQPRTMQSTLYLGLLAGGGVNVPVTHHVSIDGEFKWLYLVGGSWSWARFAIGTSYRF